MVVPQHPAAPGQGVLVECVSLLILAQLAQIGCEPAGRGEGVGTSFEPRPFFRRSGRLPGVSRHPILDGYACLAVEHEFDERSQRSCLELHPDYEYKVGSIPLLGAKTMKLTGCAPQLWTDEKAREFIAKEYPWFLETFDNYPYPIQRADSIRYFVLSHYGGVYLDLDDVCRCLLE